MHYLIKSKTMSEYQHVTHTFAPLYDEDSKILILGSFPSVKSREQGFYYGHKQNRFWKVISAILGVEEPQTIDEKKKMLLKAHIAVYDVIESCDIIGSSDSSIRNVVPSDIATIVANSNVKAVFCNGKTAGKLYKKYQAETCNLPMTELPSTSPANATCKLGQLIEIWNMVKEYF